MQKNNQTKFKEIEIGLIPEEWDYLELAKFAELARDSYVPSKNEDLSYIGLEHINQQTLSLNSIGKSAELKSNKFIFKDGDILFGKLRPYFRKVYRPNFSGVCSTDIWVVRAKTGFDQGWLFYLLASEGFIKLASEGSGGTRMPRADWSHLKNIPWPIPNLVEQKQIAEVLSSLDDKIELNRKVNTNLEKLANTLFKQWFVDFEFPNENGKPYKSSGGKIIDSELGEIPDGWQIRLMTDFVDIDKGLSYKGSDLNNEGENLLVGLKCFERGGGFRTDGVKRFAGEFKSKHLLNPGDLIVAMTDLTQGAEVLGKPAIVPNIKKAEHMVASLDVSILRPKTYQISKAYLYTLFMRQETQDYLFGYSNGSTVLHLSIKGLNEFKLAIAPDDVFKNFNNFIKPIFDQIQVLNSELQDLQTIRDSLLPRLMSGKIRVT